jgi:hypothetical protein
VAGGSSASMCHHHQRKHQQKLFLRLKIQEVMEVSAYYSLNITMGL